jgi:hypothetical protein
MSTFTSKNSPLVKRPAWCRGGQGALGVYVVTEAIEMNKVDHAELFPADT